MRLVGRGQLLQGVLVAVGDGSARLARPHALLHEGQLLGDGLDAQEAERVWGGLAVEREVKAVSIRANGEPHGLLVLGGDARLEVLDDVSKNLGLCLCEGLVASVRLGGGGKQGHHEVGQKQREDDDA